MQGNRLPAVWRRFGTVSGELGSMCFIPRLPKMVTVPRMAGAGYVVRSTRLVNRGGSKSIAQAVWDKVGGDGTVIVDMGPSNLLQSLDPIWPEDRNHITVKKHSGLVCVLRLPAAATRRGDTRRCNSAVGRGLGRPVCLRVGIRRRTECVHWRR